MSILNNSLLLGAPAAGGYQITRSLRFNSADSAYLSRTPASNGTSYTTWTWSMWVKRSLAATGQVLFSAGINTQDYLIVNFEPGDTLRFLTGENGSTNQNLVTTTAVFRDYSAWYHFVIQADFTNATQADRIKIFANGVRQTLSGTIAAQNYTGTTFNRSGIAHNIGRQGNGVAYLSGYLADIHFIDGQALTPSSFGEFDTNGIWQPKAYTGSYGTNGFRLPFSDNSAATATTLGKDSAGSNNWTPNNLSVTAGAGNDSLVDSPVNGSQVDTGAGGEVRGNYCTLNPLDRNTGFALSNGNLDGSTGTSVWRGARGTFGVTSGKWYFECIAGSADTMVGIADSTTPITDPTFPGYTTYSYGYYGQGGVKYNSNVGTAYGSGYTTNDVIGVAFDADNGKVFFSKNGTWQASGDPSAGTNAAFTGLTGRTFFPMLATYSTVVANFGQRPFAYTAPSGFKALCTTNLPTPTGVVAQPSTAFDAVPYTGSSGSQSITTNFSPDFVWVKTRNASTDHELYDVIRGAGVRLSSNNTLAESNIGTSNGLASFNSNGFTVPSTANYGINGSGYTYAAWAWDAGSSTVTNTQGSITSSVRANASAGFSICTFTTQSSGTGAFGHGLNIAPSLVITKARAVANNWITYHASVGNTGALLLNSTAATDTQSFYWNNTTPTSSAVTLGSGFAGSNSLVAYCFAPVAGYSAFGSYPGNGSSDGPFVYTGFRPRWIVFKQTNVGGQGWFILDTARSTYNVASTYLLAQSANAEVNGFVNTDLCSNGFKIRSSDGAVNASGGTYIYAAFAEFPFQFARAR